MIIFFLNLKPCEEIQVVSQLFQIFIAYREIVSFYNLFASFNRHHSLRG